MTRSVHLGVTGLRQSGKTVFLTALAYQLTQCGSDGLDTFTNRGVDLFPGRRFSSGDAAEFPVERNLSMLQEHPPRWPQATTAEGELTIELTYLDRRASHILFRRRRRSRARRLRIHLHDYPGEYLLDVEMVRRGMSYDLWSREALARIARQSRDDHDNYIRQCAEIETSGNATTSPEHDGEAASAPTAVTKLMAFKRAYAQLLIKLRNRGFEMLQPGMALAGLQEWSADEIAKQLPFVPLPPGQAAELRPVLTVAFESHQRDKVRPFLGRLGRCDRQLVLVDVFRILRNGLGCHADTRECLASIIDGYTYSRSWARRLVPRKILPMRARPAAGVRRVVLAATKADHATRQDRGNLSKLLDSLAWRFKGNMATVDARRSLCFASLRCTKDAEVQHNGVPLAALEGRVLDDSSAEPRRLFPGHVPEEWAEGEFCLSPSAFPDFRPQSPPKLSGKPWPQLNLGTLIWALLFE